MKVEKLTHTACPEHKRLMAGHAWKFANAGMLVAGMVTLGGCVTVNAPAEPIVIQLNINITSEVIYRLAEDAGTTIDENADIF